MYDDGVITIASSAASVGLKVYTCVDCAHKITEEILKLSPEITEQSVVKFEKWNNNTMVFRSDAAYEDFIEVKIDGKTLPKDAYTIRKGSIVIELNEEYAKTLKNGDYKLEIVSKQARQAQLKEKQPLGKTPIGCFLLYNEAFLQSLRYMMTHTCPIDYLPTEMFMSTTQNATIKRKPRKAKLKKIFKPDIDRSTEIWLGDLEKKIDYEVWFCGHYHIDKQIDKVQMMYQDIRPLNMQLFGDECCVT